MYPIKIHILEVAQIGCKNSEYHAGFCVYTCATNSDLCQMWVKDQIFCANVNAALEPVLHKHSVTNLKLSYLK